MQDEALPNNTSIFHLGSKMLGTNENLAFGQIEKENNYRRVKADSQWFQVSEKWVFLLIRILHL